MSEVKWLLVGAGDIARKRVAPALAGAQGSTLAAVCDVNRENARQVAGQYGGGQVYTEIEEALEKSGADAVYLATPIHLHVRHAIQVLQAGKHVLVEKPLSLNAAEAAELLDAADGSGLVSGCSYFRRLFPAYQHLQKLLAEGTLGQIVLARMVYYSWFSPAEDDPKYWRVQRSRSGGGPISDMGSHMFDVLIGLLGMPKKLFAQCDTLVNDWDVEDAASILMTLQGGTQVNALFGWCSKTWRHEFEVVGTEGRVNWLPFDSGQVHVTMGRENKTLQLPPAENVHLPLVEDFVAALRAGRPPVCPLSEAVKTNRLIDAIYDSSTAGKVVTL